MKKTKKYLTIKEKKEMVLKGETVPLCVYSEDAIIKTKRLIMNRKLSRNFYSNISK